MFRTPNRQALPAAPSSLLGRWLLTVLAVTSLALATAHAQSAAGTIRGKITNATNGASLENVVVTVDSTKEQVRSNGYGEYVLRNVPAGEVTLHASYIGEPEQTVKVTVAPGTDTTKDFLFRQTDSTKRLDDGTVVLDRFVVSTERYKNARAIAVAEERNSVNIKNVVSVDEFGDIPSGNVGEFVKFLPGIQVDYGAAAGNGNNQGYSDSDASGVSVRGFGPEDTAILIDGMPVSATVPGSLTRQVGLDQLSINNAERVELIKVATPDMPNNSLGGSINLITKSAFEYAKPTYKARLFLNFNSQDHQFDKTPGPVKAPTRKMTPGIELSATYPWTKNFGVTFTAYGANEFHQGYRAQPVWNNTHATNYQNGAFVNAAGVASSSTNPVLTRYQVTDSPNMTDRKSANLKFDWRITPSQVLKVNFQYSTYATAEAQRRLDFRPTIAATGADWDGTKVIGTTANSTTAMTLTTRDREGDTKSAQAQYELNYKSWKISAAASRSTSISDFQDRKNGHFSGLDLNLNPGQVALMGLRQGIPNTAITLARTTNAPLDYTQLANWTVANLFAQSGEAHNEDTKSLYKVDIQRDIDFLPFLGTNSLVFKIGAQRDEEKNLKSGIGTNFREILNPGKTFLASDILDTDYKFKSPGFGLAPQQWASTYKLYDLDQAQGLFYAPTTNEATNTAVNNYNSYVGQQKSLTETKDGYYAMLTGNFFSNRLTVVGGARVESSARKGLTAYTDTKWNFVRTKNGTIYTDATHPSGVRNDQAASDLFAATAAGTALRTALTSAGIAFPTVPYGAVASDIAARMLNFQANHEIDQKVTGDPSYSISAAYKLTKKIDLKAAWSRSFGLQPLESGGVGVLPGTNNYSINEFTDVEQAANNGAKGQITLANPGLKPQTSDNIDLEASYYTDTGSKLSVNYFNKSVTNQIETYTTYSGAPGFDEILTAVGLDPAAYDSWRIVTSANSSTVQKTHGWEFEVRQDFGAFGKWGRRIQAFVSYSFNSLPDPAAPTAFTLTNPDGTTTSVVPAVTRISKRANKFGGAGLQYSGNKFSLQIRGTYKNDNEITSTGNPAFLINNNPLRTIQPAEMRFDVNMSYSLSKNYSLFLSGRDVLHGERDVVIRDDAGLLPAYAQLQDRRRFGVTWTVGVNGTW